MLLGCIADDFTGATDLANTLVRAGMRTLQTIGVPGPGGIDSAPDAVVVALKTRTIPAADAVAQSLAALTWLRAQGAHQIYFKYCSTFDSTDAGNRTGYGSADGRTRHRVYNLVPGASFEQAHDLKHRSWLHHDPYGLLARRTRSGAPLRHRRARHARRGDAPTKEALLHLAMYRQRPRDSAVVHLHAPHSVAVSILADTDPDDALPPLTAYYAMRVGKLPMLPS